MDSKYAFFDKNGSNGNTTPNGKRKQVYGSLSGSPQTKKPSNQYVSMPVAPPTQAAATSTSNSHSANKKETINDKSREKLPIIGVREQ